MVFQNYLRKTGKESSTLVSDIIKISILALFISAKGAILFRIELIFKYATISLLRLPLRIVCRLELVLDFAFSRVFDKNSLTATKSQGKKDQSVLFI